IQCTLVKPRLPADRFEQRRLARFKAAPQNAAQERVMLADERELELVNAARVEQRMANHAPLDRSELQIGGENIAIAANDELGDDRANRICVALPKTVFDRRNSEPAKSVVGGDER